MIQSFEIENFKCFTKWHIDLSKISILAGANSSGKSSIIQSLLLSRITFERLKAVNFEFVNPLTVPLNGEYLLSLGNTQEIFNRELGESSIKLRFNDVSNNSTQFELNGDYKQDSVYELDIEPIKSIKQMDLIGSIFSSQFHYLNAERIGPRLKYEAASFLYPTVGFQGEYCIQVLSNKSLKVEKEKQRDETLPPSLLAQSRAWMEFIVPGVTIDDANLLGKLKTAEVSFSKSSPTNVGFGVSYVLPIVIAGLIAPKGCMFIVENPEAHLHPSGQSKIGQFLAKVAASGVQVVVETHSEHVINGVRIATLNGTLKPEDALVNFFSKESNKPIVQIIHFTPKGDLEKWPLGFFDQQQFDFADIIRLRNSQK